MSVRRWRLARGPCTTPALPVRAAIPLPRGLVDDAGRLVVENGRGSPAPTQARCLLRWPDGSCKWAMVLCDPADPCGDLYLRVGGTRQPETALVEPIPAGFRIDTGRISLEVARPPVRVDERDRGVLTGVRRGDARLTGFSPDAGLVVTEHDGRVYGSQKASACAISLIEDGPVRALVRIEGRTAFDARRGGLDYRMYLEAYRDRSLVRLLIAWIHGDGEVAHWIRDIRFRVPLAFPAVEASFGTRLGTCRTPIGTGQSFSLVQETGERFRARRTDAGGRRIDLASGAAGGTDAPGWLQVAGADGRRVSVFVPGFRDEYPDELAFAAGELSVGLWPEGAAERIIGCHDLLPPLLDGDPAHRHRKLEYECLVHHPYWAFLDTDRSCLETVQGMQKTQELVFEFDPGLDADEWGRRTASGATALPRAWPDRELAEASGALDVAGPADPGRHPEAEALLSRSAAWLVRHGRAFGVAGKFDRGDLRYLVHDTLDTRPWRGVRDEHPRSGSWNNNEGDPVHGLFLHAMRTGSAAAAAAAELLGRHLWDIDVRHAAPWGVHTHTEGHCFRSQTWSGTDHFWFAGLAGFYLLTGEPDVLEGIGELADATAEALADLDPAAWDTRSVAVGVQQAVTCFELLDRPQLLDTAARLVGLQLAEVTPHGFFADYGSAAGKPRRPSLLFGSLFVQAVGALERWRPDRLAREAALRQVDWFLAHAVLPGGASAYDPLDRWDDPGFRPDEDDPGSTLELLACLAHAWDWTRDHRYLDAGRRMLAHLAAMQCDERFGPRREGLIGDGGPLAWGSDGLPVFAPPDPTRPAGQIRPDAASVLRCVPGFLAALDSAGSGPAPASP